MSAYAYDRLVPSAGVYTFDRLVDTTGVPIVTSVGTITDGAAITITGTSFSASGNLVLVVQGTQTLQVPVSSEGTTSITTGALNTTGLYLTQPVNLYVLNASAVQSNSIQTSIQPASGALTFAISQGFLGDSSTRLASSPDDGLTDEWRVQNIIGGSPSDFTFTGQGAFKVAAAVTAYDAAIFDGTILSPFVTQTLADALVTIVVPNVQGETLAVATTQLQTLGFVVSVVANVQDPATPFGSVSTQFPPNPTALVAGGTVELTLSLGTTGVLVPNFIGSSLAIAIAARQAAGLVGATLAYIDGINSGNVLNQSVTQGTPVLIGSTVDIVYSSNIVPNVVGQLIQNANAILTAANLVVGSTVAQTVGGIANFVAFQSPVPNSPVNPGDTVSLTTFTGIGSPVGSGVSGAGVSGPHVSRGPGVSGAGVSSSGNTAVERLLTESGNALITESGDHITTES